jgi:hypothetical protein
VLAPCERRRRRNEPSNDGKRRLGIKKRKEN